MQIDGRLVVVTGASSGIGAATARAVARAGGRVLLLARTRGVLEQVAGEITAAGGTAYVYPVDLADVDAVAQVCEMIVREVGIPDILINNAGAGRWFAIDETPPGEAVRLMALPYFAAFEMTRALVPGMRQRKSGHIVNITSAAGFLPWPGSTGYAVARWAMRGFSESLRADLVGTGIAVTLLTATTVQSPYFANNPGARERLPRIAGMYHLLTPEEVAAAIVDGIQKNRRNVVIPFLFRLTLILHRIWPRPVELAVIKSGWSPPGSAPGHPPAAAQHR